MGRCHPCLTGGRKGASPGDHKLESCPARVAGRKKNVAMFAGQLLRQASKCMVEVLLEYFDACTFLGFSQVQAIQFSHVTHVQHKTDTGTSLLNQT